MSENILVITVGLPRSGKSTWAKTLGAPIVSCDAIRQALGVYPFVPKAEKNGVGSGALHGAGSVQCRP